MYMLPIFTVANASVLISEDFEDGDSVGWLNVQGTWSVKTDGTKVFSQTKTSDEAISVTGSVLSKCSLEGNVKILSFKGTDKYAGLIGNYKDKNNYYFLSLSNGNKLVLGNKVNGTFTTLSAKAITVGINKWYTLKLVIADSKLEGYLDGNLEVTATDSSLTDGKPGLLCSYASAEFDNIKVDNNSGPTLPAGSYTLTVAKDGSTDYKTIQDAINVLPDNNAQWCTINVKNGTYREVINVPASKPRIKLIGESAANTIITYDNCSSTAGGTGNSATAFLQGNDFIAQNIAFENSFDYDNSKLSNKQAVAAEPMGDRQIFVNCRFTGYQDTLYVRNGRQYFKDCYINGHTDFIFGDATAVFENCEIYSRYKSGASVSAPSTLQATSYGLTFIKCNLTADPKLKADTVFLGRPWHPSSVKLPLKSSAAYLNCNLGAHIKIEGWTKMGSVNPSTERLVEYKNTGTGAAINSTRPQLSDSQAANYTVKNILKGNDNWDPVSVSSYK